MPWGSGGNLLWPPNNTDQPVFHSTPVCVEFVIHTTCGLFAGGSAAAAAESGVSWDWGNGLSAAPGLPPAHVAALDQALGYRKKVGGTREARVVMRLGGERGVM